MKIDATVMEALELLGRERGVSVDAILDALANALVSAYKRSPGAAEEARVTIDPDTGDITVYAQDLDDDGNVTKEWEDTPNDFGRIAAQTAKQVIQQRLRDAKREQVFEVYAGREGDLVTAIVQQVDGRFTILDLGDAEAILPGSERIPYERLDRGNRVKALILEVRNETKGPQIVVSRSHPDLVRRLLELEVPELADGTVELVAIAREPGHRTKIAVVSHDPNVDPKGACVGARGSRVRQVVNELRGEKVDVVQWRENTAQFIAEALGPAKVKEVKVDEEAKVAEVIVSDHQLSLAIGKEGQNARLAARLSGYKVDIRSDHVPEPPPAPAPAPAEPTMPAEAPAPAEEQAASESTAPEEEPAALVGADSQPEEQLTTEAD
ncbi:MAG: transcription termination/antitermination protein NusA [Acidimicrobiia bacterium]|nr:transcription termination/antitermination protein NusA [Acidimicrobiia bacterium]MDQ3499606.1 transcription termination factor NusA [Actinomycetota bacterium]